jgi:D-serine deaminase-like pyridoxal phosphate-dependent protein
VADVERAYFARQSTALARHGRGVPRLVVDLARPAWPRGFAPSALYGASSNQQFHTVTRSATITSGEWAFFPPTQSEALPLQFGPLLTLVADDRVATWPVLEYLPDAA